jgi:hypothetical protein
MLHASHAMRVAGGRWSDAVPRQQAAFLHVLEASA